MKFSHFLLILYFLLLFSAENQAQDVHLSQFEASPIFLNPALGGIYNGDWRIGNSVREQWRSIEQPYQSFVLFYDRRFNYFSKQINAGLMVVHDRSGDARLRDEKIYLSVSYPLTSGKSVVSAGIQPGLVLKYYDTDITLPEQFDHSIGYFNSELPNNESALYGNTNSHYFDLNAGIYWQMKLPRLKPSAGLSLLHINQPDESFVKNGSKKSIRINIHGNSYFYLKNNQYIKPSFYYISQNKANQLMLGGDFGIYFKGSEKVIRELYAGLYFRSGYNRNYDAVMPVAGLQYMNWRIGFNYDINVSDLSAASNNRGAFEISIIYTAPSSAPHHTAIPCDRY